MGDAMRRRGFLGILAGALSVPIPSTTPSVVSPVAAQPAPFSEPSYSFDGEAMILSLESLGFRFEVDCKTRGFSEWFPQYPLSIEQDRAYRAWWKACYADVKGSEKCEAFLRRRAKGVLTPS